MILSCFDLFYLLSYRFDYLTFISNIALSTLCLMVFCCTTAEDLLWCDFILLWFFYLLLIVFHIAEQVLLYDEPTAGLDPIASTVVEDLIRSVHMKGEDGKPEKIASYVVVTHQHSTIRRAVDRFAVSKSFCSLALFVATDLSGGIS